MRPNKTNAARKRWKTALSTAVSAALLAGGMLLSPLHVVPALAV